MAVPRSKQTPGANWEPAGRRPRPQGAGRNVPLGRGRASEGLRSMPRLSQLAVAGGRPGADLRGALCPEPHTAATPSMRHVIGFCTEAPRWGLPYRALSTSPPGGEKEPSAFPPEEAGGPARRLREECTRSQAAVPTMQPLPAALVTWAISVTEEAKPAQLQGRPSHCAGGPGQGRKTQRSGPGRRLLVQAQRARSQAAGNGKGVLVAAPWARGQGRPAIRSLLPPESPPRQGPAQPRGCRAWAQPGDGHPAGGKGARPPKVGEPRKLLAPSP